MNKRLFEIIEDIKNSFHLQNYHECYLALSKEKAFNNNFKNINKNIPLRLFAANFDILYFILPEVKFRYIDKE